MTIPNFLSLGYRKIRLRQFRGRLTALSRRRRRHGVPMDGQSMQGETTDSCCGCVSRLLSRYVLTWFTGSEPTFTPVIRPKTYAEAITNAKRIVAPLA